MSNRRTKSYGEKLRDTRWQQVKTRIQIRDNWTCRECGTRQGMHSVHHCLYLPNTEPWDHPDRYLRLLCDPGCHQEREKVEKELVLEYKKLMAGKSLAELRLMLEEIRGLLGPAPVDPGAAVPVDEAMRRLQNIRENL